MKLLSVMAAVAPCLVVAACNSGSRPQPSAAITSFAEFQAREAAAGLTSELESNCGERCQLYRQEFRYVAEIGREIYCYWDLKKAETGLDFEMLARNLEQEITDDTDASEYFFTLTKWAAAFHDGHVNVMPGEDPSLPMLFQAPLGLAVLGPDTDHERVLVADPVAADSGLVAGEQVVAVNGVAIDQALDELEKIRSGSTARMRRSRPSLLINAYGAEAGSRDLTLRVAAADGTQRDVPLYRSVSVAPTVPPVDTGNTDAVNSVKTRILPGGVGYLRLDTFAAEGLPEVVSKAMDSLTAVRGLVIDVRRNGGGDQASGNAVLERLLATTKTRYEVAERVNPFILNARPEYFFERRSADVNFNEWHKVSEVKPVSQGSLAGIPVVVLTGPRCFSACDTFTAALKSHGLATVMGEATGGGTGTPLVFALPVSSYNFRYSVVRGRTVGGDWIEGRGTAPDVAVEPDRLTALGRADNQIEQAYAHVLNALGSPRPAPVAPGLLATHGSVYAVDAASLLSDLQDLGRVARVDEL